MLGKNSIYQYLFLFFFAVTSYLLLDKLTSPEEPITQTANSTQQVEKVIKKTDPSPEGFLKNVLSSGDINSASYNGLTPLEKAIVSYNLNEVEAICNAGAKVNLLDSNKLSALWVAVLYDRPPDIIRSLLKYGANANFQSNDMSVLMLAAYNSKYPETIQALCDSGATVAACDKKGCNALMFAAMNNKNSEVISTLLRAGADPRVKACDGATAHDFATHNPALVGIANLLK